MQTVAIAPGHWLSPAAAASYAAMRAAGMPAGGISDAGRTRAEQERLYQRYLRGELKATAAKPGQSNHETGNALDMDTGSAAHTWLLKNGARYGWTRPLSNEPWHWEYRGAGGVAGGVVDAAGRVVSGVRDFVSDPLGLSAAASDVRKVVIQTTFVLAGLGLIVLGAHRMVAPAVNRTVAQIGELL